MSNDFYKVLGQWKKLEAANSVRGPNTSIVAMSTPRRPDQRHNYTSGVAPSVSASLPQPATDQIYLTCTSQLPCRQPHQTSVLLQEQLNRIEDGVNRVVKALQIPASSSQGDGTAEEQPSLLGRLPVLGHTLFGGSTSRKLDKKQAQELIKSKDEEIRQLKDKLKEQENKIQELRNLLQRQKDLTEHESQEAKKAKQESMAMVLKVRSWDEGHHSPGKKTKSSISDSFTALFKNYALCAVKCMKEGQQNEVADSEYKTLLNGIFEVTYKECKSILFSSMFEELFKPHDSANPEHQEQIKHAKQLARIYGFLYEKMDHTTSGANLHGIIIGVIKNKFPNLEPLLSKDNALKNFVQMATDTAWSMVTMKPPMIATCPSATVAKLNSAIHEKREFGWDKRVKGNIPLVYLRPIFYISYATSQPEEKALVVHGTSRQQYHNAAESTIKTYHVIEADDDALLNQCDENDDEDEDV